MSNSNLSNTDPDFDRICNEIKADLEVRLIDSLEVLKSPHHVSMLTVETIQTLLDHSSTWYETEQLSKEAAEAFEKLNVVF